MNTTITDAKARENSESHPCFDQSAKHTVSRVHLPVAPKCNIQCGFCNRKFDCVNESRPGVTSRVLSPTEALEYVDHIRTKLSSLGVVGIAGPGDPLANPDETLETLQLIGEHHPDLKLCLSTNGLGLPPVASELAAMKVNHVTVTVNSVDPEIGAKIYPWMRIGNRNKNGVEAAQALQSAQEMGIRILKDHGVTVKINMIAIPGINDGHLMEVARTVKEWGADLINIIPLIPVKGTKFENLHALPTKDFVRLKNEVSEVLPLMLHCARCRADAVGLIGKDQELLKDFVSGENSSTEEVKEGGLPDGSCCASGEELSKKLDAASKKNLASQTSVFGEEGDCCENPIRAAVATREGFLVNAHLGEVRDLWIFEKEGDKWNFMEKRPAPSPGSGHNRWTRLSQLVADCQGIFVGGVGPNPRSVLEAEGLSVNEVEGTINAVLAEWARTGGITAHKKRSAFQCGSTCQGSGGGCG